jgi:hypothetical protein
MSRMGRPGDGVDKNFNEMAISLQETDLIDELFVDAAEPRANRVSLRGPRGRLHRLKRIGKLMRNYILARLRRRKTLRLGRFIGERKICGRKPTDRQGQFWHIPRHPHFPSGIIGGAF